MEPKDKSSEMYRLWDLSAGFRWVEDPAKMLFACLTNVSPREAYQLEFNGVVPPTFQQAAMLLYRVAADSEELKGLASQRICGAIETFLLNVLSPQEVAAFKEEAPMKTPIKRYKNILEELAAEGIS